MGLLDDLARQLGGTPSASTDQTAQLVQGMLRMLSGPQTGGIDGMAQRFQQHGFGDLVNSWIGTGQNQPISAQDLSAALGHEQIGQLAQQAGIGTQQASGLLAQILPMLIDQLTPSGKMPQQGNLLDLGLALLRGGQGR